MWVWVWVWLSAVITRCRFIVRNIQLQWSFVSVRLYYTLNDQQNKVPLLLEPLTYSALVRLPEKSSKWRRAKQTQLFAG